MTEIISSLKGIFQGDGLSVIWFILSVNPLSHLLKRLKGYAAGNERNINITHIFFVDDLKLYAGTTNNLKKLLDFVTTFSKDIDMKFGVDKCAYIKISLGSINVPTLRLVRENKQTAKYPLKGTIIQPVANGDTYKYLGQDEDIAYVGEVNK